MPTDVVMPQMGESIFEGTITKWLKKAGDPVEKDEPLFEISTDKVDAEIPSPISGVLSEIKVGEGATVTVNTVVAVIASEGEAVAESKLHEAADGSAEPVDSVVPPTAISAEKAPSSDSPPGSTAVVMPQMGESIFEGTITRWLKKIGDAVQKDEPLFEISTDKVDAEIPAPVAGVLSEIKIPEGATVEVNTIVAIINDPNSAAATPAASAHQPAAQQKPTPPSEEKAIAATPAVAAEPASSGPLRSSPLVRRIARENNLDLRRIAGTGSAGRITKDDVLKHLATRGSESAAAPLTKTRQAPPAVVSNLPGQIVPLSRMRSIIADRMRESVATSPHAYSIYKVDMTRVVRLRQRERAAFEQKYGVKLTYMPFIAASAIEAVRQFPIVNSSLIENSIHYHANIHLGIAVALEWGLIVPVVRQAETLSFVALARTMADLAERARTKKLKPDEASGSTFTLTNSGVFGGEFGTPILNQPEAAILAIGGLKKEPVVITDGEGGDTIAIRSMQTYCLGFDHRLVDGADAGKFMTAFKNALETWDREIG
jgi:2-oxoglutarate dehydrogenase E2 component (dihydrolipoamide succinyltransferase)